MQNEFLETDILELSFKGLRSPKAMLVLGVGWEK